MPKVDDYKKKNAKKHTTRSKKAVTSENDDIDNFAGDATADMQDVATKKRRPRSEDSREEDHIEYVNTIEAGSEDHDHTDEHEEHGHDHEDTREEDVDHHDRSKIEFPGSDLLRAQAPEVFNAAESILDEWKKDGDFSKIEVPNPLLKTAATIGLQNAKKVEKKLEEKGVFVMAKMGMELVKSKLKNK